MDTLSPSELGLTDSPSKKKNRRTVAFYPNVNSSNKPQKPFSRSAAKRESVMALGSIEHLQHYFTKSGIAAESNPLNKPNSGMVPAIGGLQAINTSASFQEIPNFDLPPSPVIPEIVQPAFPPFVKTYEIDPENLRPGVIEDLAAVERAWRIGSQPNTAQEHLSVYDARDKDYVDVLDLLKATTRAVRSVRNYLVSLPDDTTSPLKQTTFRPSYSLLSISRTSTPPPGHTPTRPVQSTRKVSQPNAPTDPLSRVRRAALEVLTVLRALEEKARLPLEDDAYDAQSDHGGEHIPSSSSLSASTSASGLSASVSGSSVAGSGSGSSGSVAGGLSRGPSPDFLDADAEGAVSISLVNVQHVGGHRTVPVWEDEVGAFDVHNRGQDDETGRERWDERLVLGGGWLYRQDVKRQELEGERGVVSGYLDAVDEVLFEGAKEGRRGWVREREREKAERDRRGKGRRASGGVGREIDRSVSPEPSRASRRVVSGDMVDAMRGMVVSEEPEEMEGGFFEEGEGIDDEDLPEWARRSAFVEDPLGRAHALFTALLPDTLRDILPPPPVDRSSLLKALSSGQILCVAYNRAVRQSRKPWGYVSKDAIHDIAAMEAQALPPDVGGEKEKEKATKGWTFRRTDNLRLWAAALKLRYMLPVLTPNPAKSGKQTPRNGSTPVPSPLPSPASHRFRFPTTEPPIVFDAQVVARQEPGSGWEDMLERLVIRWVGAVVDERRGER